MRQQSQRNRTKPPKTSDEIVLLLLTTICHLLLTTIYHLLLTTIYHLLLTSGMSHALSLIKSSVLVDKVMRSRRICRPLCPSMSSARTWSACRRSCRRWWGGNCRRDGAFPMNSSYSRGRQSFAGYDVGLLTPRVRSLAGDPDNVRCDGELTLEDPL